MYRELPNLVLIQKWNWLDIHSYLSDLVNAKLRTRHLPVINNGSDNAAKGWEEMSYAIKTNEPMKPS